MMKQAGFLGVNFCVFISLISNKKFIYKLSFLLCMKIEINNNEIDTEVLDKLVDSQEDEIDKLIKGLKQNKIDSMLETIDEIKELIDERKQLSREIINEIESINSKIESALIQLSSSDNSSEQLKLREKQIEIEQLKLKEKLDCWRDIALLKKELRERMAEEREAETKINIFDDD